MSFDTTFDFTSYDTALTAGNTADQASIATIQADLFLLGGASGYSSVTTNRIAQLNAEVTRLNGNITKRAEVNTQIQSIRTITESQKAGLYNFFTLCGDNASNFMVRLLFNFEDMLQDQNVILLASDKVSTLDQKNAVAKLIYQQFPFRSSHSSVLMELIRVNLQASVRK